MKITKLTYDAIDGLEAMRRLLDRRFHEDISEFEFQKLQTVYDYVCKALDQIL